MQQFDQEQGRSQDYYLQYPQKNDMLGNSRMGFVQKVYGILSMQLLFTIFMCMISVSSQSFQKFQLQNPMLLIFFMVISFICMIALMCYQDNCKSVPTNYILLGVFTFAESYMVSFLCGLSDPKLVLMAAIMTMAATVSLTIYAMTTKTDFTMAGGMIFVLAAVLMIASMFGMFTDNKIFHILISSFAVILYGIYLIYDTQLIIGGFKHSLDMDDYIIGALMLYVDIIGMFIELLSILNALNSNQEN